MPVLTRFPGGGGDTGYIYQVGNIISPEIQKGTNGTVKLSWGDPADMVVDGKTLSEWKGSIVVCKQGKAPKHIEDGIPVCENTVKDKFKASPLVTDIGGAGYYYAIFPYTKDYAVNVSKENIVLCGSLDLEFAEWSDIAEASKSGKAEQWWKVGEEKKIELSSPFNTEITLQIADFNHDDLADGSGKAGITFISKEVIDPTGLAFISAKDSYGRSWSGSNFRNVVLPNIKAALPADLRDVIKKVNKFTAGEGASKNIVSTQDDLFTISQTEMGENLVYGGTTYIEGSQYSIFSDVSKRTKQDVSGAVQEWWTRTHRYSYSTSTSETPSIQWVYVNSSGNFYNKSYNNNAKICFGLCV